MCCESISNEIYIFGGYNNKKDAILNGFQIFKPKTKKFLSVQNIKERIFMDRKRASFSTTKDKLTIYIAGGISGSYSKNLMTFDVIDSGYWLLHFLDITKTQ